MRIPMKVDYGVRALVDLAQRYGGGSVHAEEIAERQGIPEPYLDQLLTTLGKSGLISSRRGRQGGHVLAKAPHEISLGMVMAGLEGSSAPLECFDAPAECTLAGACAQKDVWRSVEDAVHSVLNSTTIADLADRQARLQGRGQYQI